MNTQLYLFILFLLVFAIQRRQSLLQYLTDLEDYYFPLEYTMNDVFQAKLTPYGNFFIIRGIDVSYANCSFESTLDIKTKIGEGWTKTVFSSQLDDNMAVKKLNFNGQSYTNCLRRRIGSKYSQESCRNELINNFIREIEWLFRMRNDGNVIQLYKYCIRDDFNINMIVERGKALDILYMVQLNWQQRYNLIKQIIEFVVRWNSIRFIDFRRQQFVIIDEIPKYVDWDDVRELATIQDNNNLARKIFTEFIDPFLLSIENPPPMYSKNMTSLLILYQANQLSLQHLLL